MCRRYESSLHIHLLPTDMRTFIGCFANLDDCRKGVSIALSLPIFLSCSFILSFSIHFHVIRSQFALPIFCIVVCLGQCTRLFGDLCPKCITCFKCLSCEGFNSRFAGSLTPSLYPRYSSHSLQP